MKITTKLAINYLKKNKKRSMVTIIRNSSYNNTYNHNTNTSFKLSRIYGKYRKKQEKLGSGICKHYI